MTVNLLNNTFDSPLIKINFSLFSMKRIHAWKKKFISYYVPKIFLLMLNLLFHKELFLPVCKKNVVIKNNQTKDFHIFYCTNPYYSKNDRKNMLRTHILKHYQALLDIVLTKMKVCQ